MNKHHLKPLPGRPKDSPADIKVLNDQFAKAFGKAVRIVRQRMDISQENLAYISGIERSHMGKIERGLNLPSLLSVMRIAMALEISATDLIEEMEKQLRGEEG